MSTGQVEVLETILTMLEVDEKGGTERERYPLWCN